MRALKIIWCSENGFIIRVCAATLNSPVVFLQCSVKMVTLHAVCALISLAPLLVLSVPPIWTQPEQVHLSFPGQCMNCLCRFHVFSVSHAIFPLANTSQHPVHMDCRFADALCSPLNNIMTKSTGVFTIEWFTGVGGKVSFTWHKNQIKGWRHG